MNWDNPIRFTGFPSTSAASFSGMFSVPAWQTVGTTVGSVIGTDGSGMTVTDWTVNYTDPSPGSYLLEMGTMAPNGTFAASGLQVTCGSGTTTSNSGGTTVTFNAGDWVVVRSTPSSSPAAFTSMNWDYTCGGTNQSLHSSISALTTLASNTTKYINVTLGGGFVNDKASEAKPCPHNATFGNLYIRTNQDPGNGVTVKCTIWTNPPSGGRYTTAGGSNTIVTCTITGNGSTNTQASYTGTRVSVNALDLVQYEVVVTGTVAAGTHLFIGPDQAPSNPGDAMYFLELVPSAANATSYVWPSGVADTTAESGWQTPVYASTATRLAVMASSGAASVYADLPNGNTDQVTIRKNLSSTGSPSVTITGTGGANPQGSSDTGHSLSFSRGDKIDVQSIVVSGSSVAVHVGLTRTFPATATSWGPLLSDQLNQIVRAQ